MTDQTDSTPDVRAESTSDHASAERATPAQRAEEGARATASGFASLGLPPELLSTLAGLGYEEPTPIQREAIPPLLEGKDLLGQAATGTGKTAAFALPLLARVTSEPADRPQPGLPRALVLVPTRELAMQVAEAIHRYGKERRATVLPIYGGQSFGQQVRVLDRGVDVVVATPGRALDHLTRGTMKLSSTRTVILDEADEMLDMGFAEDLEAILSRLPAEHQTALFSATMAPRILAIAKQHLKNPVRVSIARERTQAGEMPRVRQTAYVVPRGQKHAALARVLDMESPTSAIVFCRTRVEVDELTEAMNAHGYRAEALHGGFMQEHRDRVMKRFRANKADLLIATDVAARGLDIEHVSHVVNYDVPTEPDAYVHRIGRTGRAGREGVAITFVEPREQRLLRNIQSATQQKIAVATLPTVADLRHRRLELTRASLKEAVLAGELEPFRALVGELATELDLIDVAAAAIKLAHQASHAEADAQADEQDVVLEPAPRRERPFERDRPAFGKRAPREDRNFGNFGPREERGGAPAPREDRGGPSAPREDRGGPSAPREERGAPAREGFAPRDGGHGGWGAGGGPQERGRGPRAHGFETVRLFIGSGRMDQIRPGDLVGAIANEAGLPGDAIGSIEIADRFSLVEVPEDFADDVIQALRNTKLRGRKVIVRRDRAS